MKLSLGFLIVGANPRWELRVIAAIFGSSLCASCGPSEDRQEAPSSVATSDVAVIHGVPLAPDEWLEEQWVIRDRRSSTIDKLVHGSWQESRLRRRVRQPRTDEFEVELWPEGASTSPELYRVGVEQLRNERPYYRDFDELSFPHTLLALPLRGEVRESESAPFVMPLLGDLAVPLSESDRIVSRVTRIEGDTVFVGVSYSSDRILNGQSPRSLQIDGLAGTVEVSRATGRPIRLRYEVFGRWWSFQVHFHDSSEEFTTEYRCEWTYPRDPSSPYVESPQQAAAPHSAHDREAP